MSKLSVYGGTGFVGGNFSRMYPDDTIVIPRDQREPESNEILYLISTVDNYNVHTNITLDVETNLKVLCETLDKCRDLDVTFNLLVHGLSMGIFHYQQERILIVNQLGSILLPRGLQKI